MSLTSKYNELIDVVTKYAYKLNNYTEESFLRKKQDDIWSAAEVYAHITSANRLTVKGMHKMLKGEATEDSSPLSWKAKVMFFFGSIPYGRKAPEVVIRRTPKYNGIADAKSALDDLEAELMEIWENRHSWSKTQKLKHPSLGLLNSEQWIRFMLLHSKHHLKQLDRIRRQ